MGTKGDPGPQGPPGAGGVGSLEALLGVPCNTGQANPGTLDFFVNSTTQDISLRCVPLGTKMLSVKVTGLWVNTNNYLFVGFSSGWWGGSLDPTPYSVNPHNCNPYSCNCGPCPLNPFATCCETCYATCYDTAFLTSYPTPYLMGSISSSLIHAMVTSAPPGIECDPQHGGACTAFFPTGTQVTLSGSGLDFEGDCTGSYSCTLVMDAHKRVHARF